MKEIENKIRASFAEEKPNVRDRIMSSLEGEEVVERVDLSMRSVTKRRLSWKYCAIAASLLVTFLTGLVSGSFIFGKTVDDTSDGITDNTVDNGTSSELASVYIDVNPSIEIKVSENGTVSDCIAANEDAEAILGEMKLAGVEIKTALNAIIGSMYMNGYLSESSNSMLISMNASTDRFGTLLTEIVNDANDILTRANINCSILAQDCSKDGKTGELAEKNHVSVGKMTLIEKIIAADTEYTDEDISELSSLGIKELNRLYASFANNGKDDGDGKDEGDRGNDIFFGVLEENREDAVELSAEHLSLKLGEEIDDDDLNVVSLIPENVRIDKFKYKLTYIVMFEYGGSIYVYRVDCEEETVEEESGMDFPFSDLIPNSGGGKKENCKAAMWQD